MWGLALALNTTMTMVNTNNITGIGRENLVGDLVPPFEQFTYSNAKMGCLITWNLRRIEFSGVSVCGTCDTRYRSMHGPLLAMGDQQQCHVA